MAAVLAIGVGSGIYLAAVNSFDQETKETSKSLAEMSFDELDQRYAMLKAKFTNTDALPLEGDMIGVLLDHEALIGGLTCYQSGPEFDAIQLQIGTYNVNSEQGIETEFTVDSTDQYFLLEVDYAQKTMTVKEAERDDVYTQMPQKRTGG